MMLMMHKSTPNYGLLKEGCYRYAPVSKKHSKHVFTCFSTHPSRIVFRGDSLSKNSLQNQTESPVVNPCKT
jgi:hypothetical protein